MSDPDDMKRVIDDLLKIVHEHDPDYPVFIDSFLSIISDHPFSELRVVREPMLMLTQQALLHLDRFSDEQLERFRPLVPQLLRSGSLSTQEFHIVLVEEIMVFSQRSNRPSFVDWAQIIVDTLLFTIFFEDIREWTTTAQFMRCMATYGPQAYGNVFSTLFRQSFLPTRQQQHIVALSLPILRVVFYYVRLHLLGLPWEVIDLVWRLFLKACGFDMRTRTFCVHSHASNPCLISSRCPYCEYMRWAPRYNKNIQPFIDKAKQK